MSDTIDRQNLEQNSDIAPRNIAEDIIAGSPEELKKMIQEDYKEDIDKLNREQQNILLEKWKNESPKNIEIFDRLIKQIQNVSIQDKEVKVQDKEVKVQDKEVLKDNELASNKEQYEKTYSTAKKALEFSKNIEKVVGKQYQGDIQSSIESDIQDQKTQEYFSSLGIDLSNKDILNKPETQNILLARASVRVYTNKQAEIIDKHPDLKGNLDNLDSLRFGLGIKESRTAKEISSLLVDQPKSERGAIISTVNSLTKDSPDTMITRTGDKLSFQDPKDDRYAYDIDMDKKPLVLTKKLRGLSISRELGETRDPIREKNDKTRSEVTTLVRGVNEKKKEVLSSTMKDGSQVVSEGFSGVVSNTLSQLTLRDPAGADFSRKMLESGANVINMEKSRLEKLVIEKKTKDPLDSDIGAIQGAIREIDALIESMQRVRDKCIIQAEDPKNNHTLWEKNTNDTLRTLVGLGFDELGQENLDTLMRGISTRDNQRGIWQTGQLDMSDSFTKDKQLLDLQDIVTKMRKNSGKNERETMQDIGNSITKNEGFRNMWNNRSALSKWIQNQGNAPATKFAQNTVAGVNSENR